MKIDGALTPGLKKQAKATFDTVLERHGFRHVKIKRTTDTLHALVLEGEICLVVINNWRARWGHLRAESWLSLVAPEFERADGREPLGDVATFSAYCANFEFQSAAWVERDSVEDGAKLYAEHFVEIAKTYPSTRETLRASLDAGTFSGLAIAPFLVSWLNKERLNRFLDWVKTTP